MEGEVSSTTASAPQSAPATTTSTPAPSSTPSTPSPAPSSQPSSENNSNTSSAPSSTPAPSNNENKVIAQSGKQQLVVDAFGRRVIKLNHEQATEQPSPSQEQTKGDAGEPTQAEQAQPQQTFTGDMDEYVRQNNIQPEKYNIDEFSAALANGNVDERRVPEQYRSQYENFKITQAVAQYNAQQQAIEAQRKAQEQQINQQLTPEQRSENMATFYNSLEKEATERAKKDANLSEEDVENLPYMDEDDPKLVNYKLAKEFHRQQIMTDLQNRAAADRAKQAQQERVFANIRNFVAEAKAKEPNFDAIDVMMRERYKTLPYGEGEKIATVIQALTNKTITDAQTVELKNYYDQCRREYYAKRNGLNTQPQQTSRPPVVERPGGNAEAPQQYVPDYNALRNASGPRERRAWITQFMRAQNNRNR